MSKDNFRSVIKFKHLEGKKPKQIHEEMLETLGDTCPSYSNVIYWVKNIKLGRENMADAKSSGRPKDVSTPDVIEKVKQQVKKDPHISIRILAKMMKISRHSVFNILHKELKLKNLNSKWVPKILTKEQKKKRVDTCKSLLAKFAEDGDGFVKSIVTQDETPVYFYTPLTKQGSKVWLGAGDSAPEVPRIMTPYGKVMLSTWWDSEGIVMTTFYGKGQTMNGEIFAHEIDRLKEELKSKRRGKLTRGVNLLFDNAPIHKCHVAKDAVAKNKFLILDHPPYSPDLAPSDYWLFAQLKSKLAGQCHQSQSDLESAIDDIFDSFSCDQYFKAIQSLEVKCKNCVNVKGCYL